MTGETYLTLGGTAFTAGEALAAVHLQQLEERRHEELIPSIICGLNFSVLATDTHYSLVNNTFSGKMQEEMRFDFCLVYM